MTKEETAAQTKTSNTIFHLARPITFDGEEIKSLTFDFESLGGNELMTCARQAQSMDPNEVPMMRALSINYQVVVAARAAGVTPDLIQALKAKDFTQVTQMASNFLVLQE
ncbi:phage tail assembly protein [Paenibacillus lautus]|uniref:phage tail assembly protein n=1 Tax=Paenibacillus lautus TaxID=1401 RepID=UPI003D2C5574